MYIKIKEAISMKKVHRVEFRKNIVFKKSVIKTT